MYNCVNKFEATPFVRVPRKRAVKPSIEDVLLQLQNGFFFASKLSRRKFFID